MTVTGVGFFDSPHNQTGAAPNEIELHPVLKVGVLDGQSERTADSKSSARV